VAGSGHHYVEARRPDIALPSEQIFAEIARRFTLHAIGAENLGQGRLLDGESKRQFSVDLRKRTIIPGLSSSCLCCADSGGQKTQHPMSEARARQPDRPHYSGSELVAGERCDDQT